MTPATQILLEAFDGHDIEGVRAALDAGADPVSEQDGKKPIHWLLEQYWRSDHLPHCLKLLLDRGATLPDTLLVAVLLDDAEAVKATIQANPLLLNKKTTLISSFTSLVDATLLHMAAEYGNYNAARALVELGADVAAQLVVTETPMDNNSSKAKHKPPTVNSSNHFYPS